MCTIFTVEKAGGKCLPCVVDIRDDHQLETAVQRAVDKFGGIDIVVNNASAIHLTGTVETPMKRYTHSHVSTCLWVVPAYQYLWVTLFLTDMI